MAPKQNTDCCYPGWAELVMVALVIRSLDLAWSYGFKTTIITDSWPGSISISIFFTSALELGSSMNHGSVSDLTSSSNSSGASFDFYFLYRCLVKLLLT